MNRTLYDNRTGTRIGAVVSGRWLGLGNAEEGTIMDVVRWSLTIYITITKRPRKGPFRCLLALCFHHIHELL
ncbi:hypothetical protein XS74_22925 [Salmonella enterica subsp. enterica]|nr:hypothetical protein [Salmonella enterica subsp. enterica]